MRKAGQAAALRAPIDCRMYFDYELREAASSSPRELIILLHGFEESGRRILGKLEPVLPKDAVVLAPNAPFPIPRRVDTPGHDRPSYKLGHSWYIYNPAEREYVVDMAPGLSYLKAGIAALAFDRLPKRFIGFSQGGYFAPIAAAHLNVSRQVIGLACEFLIDEIPAARAWTSDFRLDGVFGARDEIVGLEDARSSHGRIAELGIAGELTILAETGHAINDEMRAAVARHLAAGRG